MSRLGARILVAEDEITVGRSLVGLLEDAGHDVRWARAVREVREALQVFEPDVLVLDVTLDTDGLELFQALRFAPDHPRGGVVILTEARDVRRTERARQLGAAAVVTKPVDGSRLLGVLADLLAFI